MLHGECMTDDDDVARIVLDPFRPVLDGLAPLQDEADHRLDDGTGRPFGFARLHDPH